jgi:2'-5' RNA ligase
MKPMPMMGGPGRPAQAGLEGFAPPTPPTDRLFLALFPPAAQADQLAALSVEQRAACGLSGRPLRADRLHITLHHVGDHAGFPPGLVDAAMAAAARVKVPPFEVRVNQAMSFAGRGKRRNLPFVLLADRALEGVWTLQRALGLELAKARLGRHVEKDFVPHVTMLYDDVAVPQHDVPPVSWLATDFVLVHSLIGQTKHIHLGRWPLQGGEA